MISNQENVKEYTSIFKDESKYGSENITLDMLKDDNTIPRLLKMNLHFRSRTTDQSETTFAGKQICYVTIRSETSTWIE